MSKYIQIVVVLIYVTLTMLAFETVIVVSGFHFSLRWQWLVLIGWVLFCFGSCYIWAGVSVFLHPRLRKPAGSELTLLSPALQDVLEQAGTTRRIRLRIEQSQELNAFATGHHTIAITRGLLEESSPDEVKGVLAHELGHLLSGDTIVATAFVTAGLLPKAMHQLYKIAAYIVRHSFLAVSVVQTNRGMLRVNRVNLLGGAVVLLVLGYGLYRIHLLKAVIPVIVFVFLFAVLNRIFRFFALMLSRMAEYRQDKFAYKLGYGEGLRRSLEKLAAGAEPNTGLYYIMMHSSHPIIYNRIRRLEKYLTFD